MSSNLTTEDLRSVKTERALYSAMFSLLENFNFNKITIKEICKESLISRATFYAHFIDKYDLLKHWITETWERYFSGENVFMQLENAFGPHRNKNLKILKNIVHDANDETLGILFDFLLSTQNLSIQKDGDKERYHKNVVFANFFAGGILSYFIWQIKHRFPSDFPLINQDFCQMINGFKDLQPDKR